jgi:hypothetical protein
LHRLEVAHDLRRLKKIPDYGLERGIVVDWVPILRNEMHVRQLCPVSLFNGCGGEAILTSEGLTPAAGSRMCCIAFIVSSMRQREGGLSISHWRSFEERKKDAIPRKRDSQPCSCLALSLVSLKEARPVEAVYYRRILEQSMRKISGRTCMGKRPGLALFLVLIRQL